MIYLGIDPSVNNVGLALYDSDRKKLKTATFHPIRDGETPIVNVGVQIARYILIVFLQGEKRPEQMVLEYPQWEDSDRGRMAMQKGYVHDLAYIVGYLVGAIGLAGSKVHTPTPMKWKKNITKKAIGIRFEKRFLVSANSVTDHEFEAAMMIDWLIQQRNPATRDKQVTGTGAGKG